MIRTQELDMKIQGSATQTRLEGQRDRILRQTEQKPVEGDEKEEGSVGRRMGVVYRRSVEAAHLVLKLQTGIKVQSRGQVRGGPHARRATRSTAEVIGGGEGSGGDGKGCRGGGGGEGGAKSPS